MTIYAEILLVLIAVGSLVMMSVYANKVKKLIDLIARLTAELQNEKETNTQVHNILGEKLTDIDDVACAANMWVMNNRDKFKDVLEKVEKHEGLYEKQSEVLDEELKGQKLFNEGFSNLMNYTGTVKTDE